MRSAIAIAQSALKTDDVPVGALIVDSENNIISTGFNEREAHQDPTAHAEIVAIRRAAQKVRLPNHESIHWYLVPGMKKLVQSDQFGMCFVIRAQFIKWKL
jgi:tRNA(Arg) A34 adenosine deaminase TadA